MASNTSRKSTAAHPFKKGCLYKQTNNVILFVKRRRKGRKCLVFERVISQLLPAPKFVDLPFIPECEEISIEDLALFVDWPTKYPAFNRLMKED